jgi:ABC-type sugar transport system ATPase subunit
MDVSLEVINKSFGSVRVLKDVSLKFPSRKFVTLLGPSGCGKTTLLRMIAGLETVDSGIIRFGEKVVNRLAPRDRNIAMVFQSYALYPQMSVGQNLAYGLRVRGTPKEARAAAVERVARILEIEHLLDRRPAQLSGGQRQRVALGRAMVRKPDIFLMDEPLSNLDARLRITMRAELRRFHLDLGATTVYVTHDQLEAMTMSDGSVRTPREPVRRGLHRKPAHEPDPRSSRVGKRGSDVRERARQSVSSSSRQPSACGPAGGARSEAARSAPGAIGSGGQRPWPRLGR